MTVVQILVEFNKVAIRLEPIKTDYLRVTRPQNEFAPDDSLMGVGGVVHWGRGFSVQQTAVARHLVTRQNKPTSQTTSGLW